MRDVTYPPIIVTAKTAFKVLGQRIELSGTDHVPRKGGVLLAEVGLLPDVVHTSVLVRAIRTAELALESCGRSWIPVRRSWRV